MHINGSAAIQSKVRPHFPDDITVGGHACWVFTTQTGWRCYREAVFWLFLWATETEKGGGWSRERTPWCYSVDSRCFSKCEWSKNNEAKSFSRKLQLIFVLKFTHEHCDAASGSWTFLVKLCVTLVQTLCLSLVLTSLMRIFAWSFACWWNRIYLRGSSILVCCRFVSTNALTSL